MFSTAEQASSTNILANFYFLFMQITDNEHPTDTMLPEDSPNQVSGPTVVIKRVMRQNRELRKRAKSYPNHNFITTKKKYKNIYNIPGGASGKACVGGTHP